MTTFVTHCPNCKTAYTLDIAYRGRIGVCRNCRSQFPLTDQEGSATTDQACSATKILRKEPFKGDTSFSLRDVPLNIPDMSIPDSSSDPDSLSDSNLPKTKTGTLGEAEVAGPKTDNSSVWQVGDVLLGIYEVRPMPNGRTYAEGGAGIVHRVYHREWDVELAVKSPKLSVFQVESGKISYEHECQTWIELGLHPNIVTCYLVRRIDGIPRLFAELVMDGSLYDWIRDGRLYHGTVEERLKRILDVAVQCAWGLDYSHRRGVLHLDIKPANVMLAGNNVKMTDFGLSRAVRSAEPEGEMLWNGMTPGYCSPEQYQAFLQYKAGNKQQGPPMTAQSDIWSWAITLLAMFHGRAPCKQGGQTADKVFGQYLRTNHAEHKPKMPETLVELLQHCFRVRPEDRPVSMGAIADRLVEIYEERFQEKFPRSKPPMTVSNVESLNNRAVSMFDLNKPREAKTLLAEASRLHPWQPQVTFNQAINDWRNGDLTDIEMLRQLESLVHMRPHDALAHDTLGLAQRERGNLGEAKLAFEKAVEIDPKIEYRRHLKSVTLLLDHNVACLERYQLEPSMPAMVFLSDDERFLLCCTGFESLVVEETKTGRLLTRFRKSGVNLSEEMATVDETATVTKSFSMLSEDLNWELRREAENSFVLAPLKDGFDAITLKPVSWNTSFSPGGMEIRGKSLFAIDASGKSRFLTGHEGDVFAVSSILGGEYGVSGGADKTVRLWELKKRRCLRTICDVEGLVQAVYLGRDQSFVLSLSDRSILKLWRTNLLFNESNRIRAPIMLCHVTSAEEVSQNQSELSRLCERIKTTAENGDYDLALDTIREARTMPGWESVHQELNIWETVGRFCTRRGVAGVLCRSTFQDHEEIVSSAVMASDGKTAISTGRDHVVRIWDVDRKNGLGVLQGHRDWVRSIDMTSDGRFTVSASWDQTIRLWNLTTRELIRVFDVKIRSVGRAVFSPDARFVAVSSASGKVTVLDAVLGKIFTEWQAHDAPIHAIRFSRDGLSLFTAGEDGKIGIWDIARKSRMDSLKTHHCPVMDAVISTDLKRVIVAGQDGNICVIALNECNWDGRNVSTTLKGHLGAVTTLAMTADDQWLISGSKDTTIRFWNLKTGTSLKPLTLHSKPVTCVAVDLSGTRLISSSEDQTVRIWDIEWDYEFPGWEDTAPLLDGYLQTLLRAHGFGTQMNGIQKEQQTITEQLFWRIRTELEYRGFGWIRPESLWTLLHYKIKGER